MTRRPLLLATALAGALALGACGLPDRVVGVQPVPVEVTGGAALGEPTAAAIAARVLAQADAARALTGPAGVAARKKVLTGDALTVAEAAARVQPSTVVPDPVTKPPAPTVLAVSEGRAWPRSILATTLDESTRVQRLHVLVSSAPTAPFVLAASVPMAAGSSVPALGALAAGVPMVTGRVGLAGTPKDVLTAYAAALTYPTSTPTTAVSLSDPLSTSIRANATKQAADLGALAALTQVHRVTGAAPLAFHTADGGAVVFGLLGRTDRITLTAKAKELPLTPPVVARLAGRPKVTTSVQIDSYEPVVLVVPTTGQARVIGVDEQISGAKGT